MRPTSSWSNASPPKTAQSAVCGPSKLTLKSPNPIIDTMKTLQVAALLQRSIVVVLGFCLVLPLNLFCRCVCSENGRDCCVVPSPELPRESTCDATGSVGPNSAQNRCDCCGTVRNSQATAPELSTWDQLPSVPWQPCPCLVERAQQSLLVRSKPAKQSWLGPDSALGGWVSWQHPVELVQLELEQSRSSRLPFSLHQRLALLGVWLN